MPTKAAARMVLALLLAPPLGREVPVLLVLASVAVAEPVAAMVAELLGSAFVLAVTSAGCVPFGFTSNELEAAPRIQIPQSQPCIHPNTERKRVRLTVIHLGPVELVVAAVDKQERVGAARDAVDKDLRRAILHSREKAAVSIHSGVVEKKERALTSVTRAFPIWKLPLSWLLFELSSCTEKKVASLELAFQF